MNRDTMLRTCIVGGVLSLVSAIGALVGTLETQQRVKVLEDAARSHSHEININIPEDWLK